ncbi:hypothetical protein [Thermomonospora umbrina]|uniref:Uncharacterized protein n=1 Tax=Thermomonospora umbrina TaxID=111806 RepID=A0A3D9SQJ9_9ACTN|nr:hypothetical protein [Thermomonospora umbrina]REE96770.1 hypothetical protein DFJ69_2217 [Thermomonospora umbrina]
MCDGIRWQPWPGPDAGGSDRSAAPSGIERTSPPALDAASDLRSQCRIRLLTLAADLEDLGVRPRLADADRPPFLLRCWDPVKAGPAVIVQCAPDESGRLRFYEHLSGEHLGDAENARQAGDTMALAREIALKLGVSEAPR